MFFFESCGINHRRARFKILTNGKNAACLSKMCTLNSQYTTTTSTFDVLLRSTCANTVLIVSNRSKSGYMWSKAQSEETKSTTISHSINRFPFSQNKSRRNNNQSKEQSLCTTIRTDIVNPKNFLTDAWRWSCHLFLLGRICS